MRVNETRALNPGLLRHQLVYQAKATQTARNSFGEPEVTWEDVVIVKGQVVPLMGRELESAQQRWAEARYKIRHQRTTGLARAQRIAWIQMDGTAKYLDPLDIQDEGGVGQVQSVYAKEWTS